MAIYYFGFPVLLLAAVFDSTLMTLLRFWGGAPNLVLMVVVSWALLVELDEALPWALMGGVIRDLLSMAPTGSSALAFVLIVIVIDSFLPTLSWRNVALPVVVVGVSTIFYDAVMFSIMVIDGRPAPSLQTITYVILPGMVENMLLVLVIFRTIGAINQYFRPKRASLLE